MKTNLIISMMLTAGLIGAGCESQRNTATVETAPASEPVANQADTPATDTAAEQGAETAAAQQISVASDEDFVAKAVQSGMAEVKLSERAERNAIKPEVKDFAVKMINDHTRANALLMEMARKKKWATPEAMDEEHQQVYQKLLRVMSDEFDRMYMQQMVTDHENAVALFEKGSEVVTDAELKNYISNTLPALRKHLEMAREVYNKTVAKG